MKTLPDHLEALGVDLERAATRLIDGRRRRARRMQVAAVVAATAVLGTGVGLAASGFDVFDWVRSAKDPTEVRYLVDTTRRYEGPAPQTLECPSVSGDTFSCRVVPPGPYECPPARLGTFPCGPPGRSQRIYWLSTRVEQAPRITRELLLETLDDASDEGMSPRLEERFRDGFEDVSDGFLAKLNLMMQVQGGTTIHEDESGNPIAPPTGVPLQVTCEGATGARMFRCHPLSGATDIPLGAPVYSLEPTADWVRIQAQEGPEERWAVVESFFGRPLSTEENLVFVFMLLTDDMTAAEWAELERALDQIPDE